MEKTSIENEAENTDKELNVSDVSCNLSKDEQEELCYKLRVETGFGIMTSKECLEANSWNYDEAKKNHMRFGMGRRMIKEEQILNKAEYSKLGVSNADVHFQKTKIGSRESVEYLKSVGRFGPFWFHPNSHSIIDYANEVWNELSGVYCYQVNYMNKKIHKYTLVRWTDNHVKFKWKEDGKWRKGNVYNCNEGKNERWFKTEKDAIEFVSNHYDDVFLNNR